MGINDRLTITDVAKSLGVTPRTLMRWEKAGKIKKSKRDWRGWRFYSREEVGEIKRFYETCYEFDENNRPIALNFTKQISIIAFALGISALIATMGIPGNSFAEANFVKSQGVTETQDSVDISLNDLPVAKAQKSVVGIGDPITYTLGPNDVIQIDVRRHPEFSGQYTINTEGKIEYKFVGDILITGLTKVQLKEKLVGILSEFLIEPDVNVGIVAYLSKVIYVVGEVGNPGKFYMRGNTIKVREALVQAGLPTYSAAMRRCRLITPNDTDKRNNYIDVNVYELLYAGNLKWDLEMKPGDVLYVPATAMAKIIRVISPVTDATGKAAGAVATGAAVGL